MKECLSIEFFRKTGGIVPFQHFFIYISFISFILFISHLHKIRR